MSCDTVQWPSNNPEEQERFFCIKSGIRIKIGSLIRLASKSCPDTILKKNAVLICKLRGYCVVDPDSWDPYVFGPPGSVIIVPVRIRNRILPSSSKNSKKNSVPEPKIFSSVSTEPQIWNSALAPDSFYEMFYRILYFEHYRTFLA